MGIKQCIDLACLKADEIKNVSVGSTTTGAPGTSASVLYNPTDGKFTFVVPQGNKGDKGDAVLVNTVGVFAGRSIYDAMAQGFSFLASDLSLIYFKLSATSGDWSSGVPFCKYDTDSPALTGTPTINGTPISTFGNGFKNHIIDGRFDFWYEGTSQTTSGYGSDTMWYNGNIGSTKTHTRQYFSTGEAFADGIKCPMYYSRTVVSSVAGAGSTVYKDQRLEDVTRLAGRTVTLSFYAKADTNKNIAIEFAQHFGTGGTPTSSVNTIGAQKIALTTTWTRYSRTFTIPSIVGKTIGTDGVHTSFSLMRFWFDAGSDFDARTANLGQQSGTFDIAMVQLEEGIVATDFEWNGTAVEESRVGRYFQFTNSCEVGMPRCDAGLTLQNWGAIYHKIPFRMAPTFSAAAFTFHGHHTIAPAVFSAIDRVMFSYQEGNARDIGGTLIIEYYKLDARQ
jgi:hypothetical protein